MSDYAGPSGRAVWDVGLRPLVCWDCGFESHRGHGCLSIVSVVCCQVEDSATSRSLVQRSPTDCAASLCVIYKLQEWGGPGPLGGGGGGLLCQKQKNEVLYLTATLHVYSTGHTYLFIYISFNTFRIIISHHQGHFELHTSLYLLAEERK